MLNTLFKTNIAVRHWNFCANLKKDYHLLDAWCKQARSPSMCGTFQAEQNAMLVNRAALGTLKSYNQDCRFERIKSYMYIGNPKRGHRYYDNLYSFCLEFHI